jgi:hypothetical protein
MSKDDERFSVDKRPDHPKAAWGPVWCAVEKDGVAKTFDGTVWKDTDPYVGAYIYRRAVHDLIEQVISLKLQVYEGIHLGDCAMRERDAARKERDGLAKDLAEVRENLYHLAKQAGPADLEAAANATKAKHSEMPAAGPTHPVPERPDEDGFEVARKRAEASGFKDECLSLRKRIDFLCKVASRAMCGCLYADCVFHGAFGWTDDEDTEIRILRGKS